MDRGTRLPATGLMGMLILACAASSPPTTELAEARSALGAAEAVGAEEHAAAALHLKLARDAIERAMAQVEDGEHELAARTLDRARIDAQLAEQLARYDEARKLADEAVARSRKLEDTQPFGQDPFDRSGTP